MRTATHRTTQNSDGRRYKSRMKVLICIQVLANPNRHIGVPLQKNFKLTSFVWNTNMAETVFVIQVRSE